VAVALISFTTTVVVVVIELVGHIGRFLLLEHGTTITDHGADLLLLCRHLLVLRDSLVGSTSLFEAAAATAAVVRFV